MREKFTVDWCSFYFKKWKEIFNLYKPENILEIGSFEGRSTKFWFDQETTKTVTCIDTWEGSVEHHDIDVTTIEELFDFNHGWRENLIKKKGKSIQVLSLLQKSHESFFDLIYVDGSHDPKDVLVDAVLSFNLLKSGGIMIFDDYLWINRMRFGPWHGDLPKKIIPHPKTAIDAFCNIYEEKIVILDVNYQLILKKVD